MEASWMSSEVLPSPIPDASSGSLLIAEIRSRPAPPSHTSFTCHAACTGTILWFGGHSTVGFRERVSCGGIVSLTVTGAVQLAEFPEASVAVKVTGVVPRGYGPEASAPEGVRLLLKVTPRPQPA